MPVLATLGAASARGFGDFYTSTSISAGYWISRVGGFLNDTSFDGASGIYSIGDNGLIVKTLPDGSATWKKTATIGGGTFYSYKIKPASTAVIYATGYTFGGTDPVYAVINSDGSVASARNIVTSTGNLDKASVSSSGSLYASGYTTISTSGGSAVPHYFRIYNGAVTAKRYYNNTAEVSHGFIGCGASDSAYLGASVTTPMVKINSSFSILWKVFNSTFLPLACVESNNDLYVVGNYTTSAVLVVVKLNASTGAFVWAKTLSTTNRALCVAVDNNSNVYAGGRTSSNGVIVKLDSNGNLVWQKSVAIGVTSQIKSIAVNPTTNTIYALSAPTSSSNNYSFILALPTDGSLTGTYSVGGATVTYADFSGTLSNLSLTLTAPAFSFTTSSLADATISSASTAATPSYDTTPIP